MNTQELSKKRLERIMAAINLREPDKVPFCGVGGDIIPAYAGITQEEFNFDPDKALKAIEKYLRDFPCDWPFVAGFTALDGRILSLAFADHPDLAMSSTFISGPIHKILDDKYCRFPGMETDKDASPQFVGGTFMEPEEYDELIEDPVGFALQTVLPRACNNLANPQDALTTMARLGMEINKFNNEAARTGMKLAELGFPSIPIGGAYAPLDIIGDFLRGISNTVLDLRRHPDKVKKAVEAITEPIINYALSFKTIGAELAFIPLHLNEYLSPKLYKEFYWPTLKKVILALLDEGIKSLVFFEGHHDAHMETILELPKGWGVAYFEKTDVIKAKDILKDHTCVMGGIPITLLVGGTPESIDEYIKNLLEKVKPGGGFILAPSVGTAPRETPLENLTALIEAVEKYG